MEEMNAVLRDLAERTHAELYDFARAMPTDAE
jgi:hypothetical protein